MGSGSELRFKVQDRLGLGLRLGLWLGVGVGVGGRGCGDGDFMGLVHPRILGPHDVWVFVCFDFLACLPARLPLQ